MSIERTPQNAVADRAYQLWEKAGRPPGRDLEFWLQAEAQFQKPDTREKTSFASAQALPRLTQLPQAKPTGGRRAQAK